MCQKSTKWNKTHGRKHSIVSTLSYQPWLCTLSIFNGIFEFFINFCVITERRTDLLIYKIENIKGIFSIVSLLNVWKLSCTRIWYITRLLFNGFMISCYNPSKSKTLLRVSITCIWKHFYSLQIYCTRHVTRRWRLCCAFYFKTLFILFDFDITWKT